MLTVRPLKRFLAAFVFFLSIGSSLGSSRVVASDTQDPAVVEALIKAENEFCVKVEGWLSQEIYRLYAVPQSYVPPAAGRIVPTALMIDEAIERGIQDALVACTTMSWYQRLMDQYVERAYPRRYASTD